MAKYTIGLIADELAVSRATIYRWISEGKLKGEEDERHIMCVDMAEVERLKATFAFKRKPQDKMTEFIELLGDKFSAQQTLDLVKILAKVL